MPHNETLDFLNTAIEQFRTGVIADHKVNHPNELRIDPYRFYSAGHCAEFAFTLAKYSSMAGLDANIVVIYAIEKNNETKARINKTLSHCIVEIGEHSFDICGSDARATWFTKHDYMYANDFDSHFEWALESIRFTEELKTYAQLEEHCKLHNVAFSNEAIKKDFNIFVSSNLPRSDAQREVHTPGSCMSRVEP